MEGRVAIVTGAAVGTGREFALRVAAEGAAVVLGDTDIDGGEETRQLVAARGGRALFVEADLRDDDAIRALVDTATGTFGGLHVLVNNAGGGPGDVARYPDSSPAQWGSVLDTNLRGAMLATQVALEPIAASGGGAVVTVGSSAGLGFGPHGWPEYAAAKAALIRWTACLGPLRERYGVRVNCLAPDWVGTERAYRELAGMSPAQRAAAPDPIPLTVASDALMRLVTDDELAGRVLTVWPHRAPRLLPADPVHVDSFD